MQKLFFIGRVCFCAFVFFFFSTLIRADNALVIKQNGVTFPLGDDNTNSVYLSGIQAGYGYSSDLQQVSQLQCYNTEVIDNDCKKTLNGGEMLSFDQLLSTLKIQNSKKTDLFSKRNFWPFFGFFSRGGELPYLKSIEDSEYSLSLNVAYVLKNKVSLDVKGYGTYALNEMGRDAYENGNNPRFGLICGDHYFSSFTEGAMLLATLDIRFDSRSEKEKFREYSSGSSFLNFHSSSQDIQKIINRFNIKGHVNLKAYQQGGNPEHLSSILKKDSNGHYYLMNCDMNNMQDCVNAAHNVLGYAINDFPSQISCNPTKGLYPLSTDFEYKPIGMIGLEMPESLLTSDTLQAQDELADQIDKHNQYAIKVSEAINHYPASWDKNSGFYQSMQRLAEKIKNNLDLLQYDAKICFDEPYRCLDTKNEMLLTIVIVTPEDLKDLPTVKEYDTHSSLSHLLNDRGTLERK